MFPRLAQVEGQFFVNENLEKLMLEELRTASKGAIGGFLPAVKQIANVAALPGIVQVRAFCFRATSQPTG